jgi:hypothetical protein
VVCSNALDLTGDTAFVVMSTESLPIGTSHDMSSGKLSMLTKAVLALAHRELSVVRVRLCVQLLSDVARQGCGAAAVAWGEFAFPG